jgi:hypothetical protein
VEQEGVSSEASTNRLAQYAVPSRLPDILTRKGKKTGKFQHSRRMIPPFSAFRDPTICQELHQIYVPDLRLLKGKPSIRLQQAADR